MYERLISLIGIDKLNDLMKINVLLIGLGGVGGYAFEALVRSGIMHLTIVDGDVIEESNLNRQIIANHNNIGQNKTDEALKRGLEINPQIKIKTISEFITSDNFEELILNEHYDYVIDACDDLNIKLLLITHSNEYKLISSMGTANKFNPSLFSITDLDKTSNDPIARILRRKVKDLKINRKFKVVSSTETPQPSDKLGTNSFIPGIAGLLCASYVINDLVRKWLKC